MTDWSDNCSSEMDDVAFLNYMEEHSKTPRAAFHRDYVNRLLVMAGYEPDEHRQQVRWSYDYCIEFINRARRILNEQ